MPNGYPKFVYDPDCDKSAIIRFDEMEYLTNGIKAIDLDFYINDYATFRAFREDGSYKDFVYSAYMDDSWVANVPNLSYDEEFGWELRGDWDFLFGFSNTDNKLYVGREAYNDFYDDHFVSVQIIAGPDTIEEIDILFLPRDTFATSEQLESLDESIRDRIYGLEDIVYDCLRELPEGYGSKEVDHNYIVDSDRLDFVQDFEYESGGDGIKPNKYYKLRYYNDEFSLKPNTEYYIGFEDKAAYCQGVTDENGRFEARIQDEEIYDDTPYLVIERLVLDEVDGWFWAVYNINGGYLNYLSNQYVYVSEITTTYTPFIEEYIPDTIARTEWVDSNFISKA